MSKRYEVHPANAAEFELGIAPVWAVFDHQTQDYVAVVWNEPMAKDWAKDLNERKQT